MKKIFIIINLKVKVIFINGNRSIVKINKNQDENF